MKVNPREPAQEPDAIIVIFGAAVRADGKPSGTLRHRVAAAARFGARFARPLFIPTGGKGRFGDPEAAVMARLLRAAGFAEAAILREQTGTDTLSSVRAVARLVQGRSVQGWVPVYACSSAYHLPRCLLLLRLAGIAARPCPPPLVPAATSWWRRWYWRLRETPALPYDALLMLWLRVAGRV
jgi:uncharacterized SAM-binding protein YcdF (DUF218 family)